MDLGSKAGTTLAGVSLQAHVMSSVRNGDSIVLGTSTRRFEVRIDLSAQIALLEQQQRDLLKQSQVIEADADDPIKAAKRAVREQATVFVGNLRFDCEKADLMTLFQDCGRVDEARFPGEGRTAERGIAFVVFESAMAARRACGLSGQMFCDRKVRVAPAADHRGSDAGGSSGKGGKGAGKGKSGKGGKSDRQQKGGFSDPQRAIARSPPRPAPQPQSRECGEKRQLELSSDSEREDESARDDRSRGGRKFRTRDSDSSSTTSPAIEVKTKAKRHETQKRETKKRKRQRAGDSDSSESKSRVKPKTRKSKR